MKKKFTRSMLAKMEKRAYDLFEKTKDKTKVGKIMKLTEIEVIYLLLFSRGIQMKFFNKLYT
jgi:hypothetical protein